MRQDFFEFQPQFKLIIAGNHKPSLRSVDEAIRRRFHLVPFTVIIPPSERDLDLQEKLKADCLDAILGYIFLVHTSAPSERPSIGATISCI